MGTAPPVEGVGEDPYDLDVLRKLLAPVFIARETVEEVRALRASAKILIIDDNEKTGRDLERDLQGIYGQVDFADGPETALAAIRAAFSEGKPYTAISLDLRMPGMNGDEVARILAGEGKLPPVVTCSGEWSITIRNRISVHLDTVRTAEELEAVRDAACQRLDAIPFLGVQKFRGENPVQDLVDALDAVMLIAPRVDQAKFQSFMSCFEIALVESTPQREYLESLAELVGQYRESLRRWQEIFRIRYPLFCDSKADGDMTSALRDISGNEYSFEGLGEERDDLGGFRRHGLSRVFFAACTGLESALYFKFRGRCDEPLNTLLDDPSFVRTVKAFAADVRDYCSMVTMFRPVADESVTFGINLVEDLARGAALILSPEDPQIHTSWPVYSAVVQQPIMNAFKSGGEVTISTGKVRVGDLDEESRAYFEQTHGLTCDDYVAHVQVSDTGCGIPPENLARITELHFSTFGTSGFGLNYLDKTIGKLNGTWAIESEVGVGTDFHMYFLPAPEG